LRLPLLGSSKFRLEDILFQAVHIVSHRFWFHATDSTGDGPIGEITCCTCPRISLVTADLLITHISNAYLPHMHVGNSNCVRCHTLRHFANFLRGGDLSHSLAQFLIRVFALLTWAATFYRANTNESSWVRRWTITTTIACTSTLSHDLSLHLAAWEFEGSINPRVLPGYKKRMYVDIYGL
jgi:hypothetical protein